jgi:hypothetical protein
MELLEENEEITIFREEEQCVLSKEVVDHIAAT